VNGQRIGRSIRALRHARDWTQAELGRRSGCSASVVCRLERGNLRACSIVRLERLLAVFDARLVSYIDWRGGELDRLLDADHAQLQERWSARKMAAGPWQSRQEVTYNEYGDRGSVDDLAYHQATRTLMVVELKTGIYDAGRMLMKLDEKTRLARTIAGRFGWHVASVVPCLVVADTRTNRRRIAQHPAIFTQFSCRGRAAMSWLRAPDSPAPAGLLLFVPLTNVRGTHGRRAGRQRVRPAGGGSSVAMQDDRGASRSMLA
jgi:transcriptional regulator with XRE-family HTH domain